MKYLSLCLLLLTACQRCPVGCPPEPICAQYDPAIDGSLYSAISEDVDRAFEMTADRHEGQLGVNIEEFEETVPVDHSLRAMALLINMSRGDLVLTGGATTLTDVNLHYDNRQAVPVMVYNDKGSNRVIDLLGLGNENDWRLKVSNNMPIAIRAEILAGAREFNFNDVLLTEFDLSSLNGPGMYNYPGNQTYLDAVAIKHRKGSIALSMDGMYDSLVNVTATTACGNFAANMTGYYPRLTRLTLGSRGGDVDIDLTGRWDKICRVKIFATCGNLRLKLPCGFGTSVKINHNCASICAVGMHKTWSSNCFVNPAFADSDIFLDITVEATCGKIDLCLTDSICPWWVW